MSKVEIILFALVKWGPDFAHALQQFTLKTNPTQADWDLLFLKAEKSYKDLVPDSKIPEGE